MTGTDDNSTPNYLLIAMLVPHAIDRLAYVTEAYTEVFSPRYYHRRFLGVSALTPQGWSFTTI